MRLGGPPMDDYDGPEEWRAALERQGYAATSSPVGPDADDETVRAYREAAEAADIAIAEVGAWGSNPLSTDEATRREAVAACKRHLRLADDIGARCCVNIAGSRGDLWDGPHPDNFSEETVEQVVATVQEIIDDVDPETATYSLEPMPWVVPDGPESYRELIERVDREAFGVHFDPVNMISSPRRYADTAGFVREFVDELGTEIRCVHCKDIALRDNLTVHLDEVIPGEGNLDYRALLTALDDLDRDIPLLVEHLDTAAEYEQAADHIRGVAEEVGVDLRP